MLDETTHRKREYQSCCRVAPPNDLKKMTFSGVLSIGTRSRAAGTNIHDVWTRSSGTLPFWANDGHSTAKGESLEPGSDRVVSALHFMMQGTCESSESAFTSLGSWRREMSDGFYK